MAKIHYAKYISGPSLYETFIYDNYLSFRAKGILSFLYDEMKDFFFSFKELAAYSSDTVGAVKATFKELVTLGYLNKEMLRDKNGRFLTVQYTVLHRPRKRIGDGGDIHC